MFENRGGERVFFVLWKDGKLGGFLSGKYVDDRYGVLCYVSEYEEIKIGVKNYFEWYKW